MKIDKATILGLVLSVGGISVGLVLEGGSLREMLQPTAALIVFGGTLGATLVSQPMGLFLGACRQVSGIFKESRHDFQGVIDQVVKLAHQSRKSGIIALEKDVYDLPDPFLRKGMLLAIDGAEIQDIRIMLERDIDQDAERREAEAKVLEAAGGFAPTIGIIGAVLGLIQVMKHLDDINEVGKGIAVAFVATIYGVGIANLVLLPAAKKILARSREAEKLQWVALEGTVAIAEGINPRLIQQRLGSYVDKQPAAATGSPATGQPVRTFGG